MIPRGGVWKHKQHRRISAASRLARPDVWKTLRASADRGQQIAGGRVGSFVRGPEAQRRPRARIDCIDTLLLRAIIERARVVGKIAGRAWNTILDSSQRADYNSLPPG